MTDNPFVVWNSIPDDRIFHALWNEVDGCHYSHEHKDNPRDVDDIFGTGFYDIAGGEISYPWLTGNGTENNLFPAGKHEGYGYIVRRDLGGSITDFRLEEHHIFAPPGATTRFHSFYLEARIRNPDGSIGFVLTGGRSDFCKLQMSTSDGIDVHIPLPSDCSLDNTFISRRLHDLTNPGVSWYGGRADNAHGLVSFSIRTSDAFAPINPNDPFELNLFCPALDCANNGSILQLLDLSISIPGGSGGINFDSDFDGIFNFSGYTDRHGTAVLGCTEPGVDCVPLELINVHAFTLFSLGELDAREYDISPPGKFWIEYPN